MHRLPIDLLKAERTYLLEIGQLDSQSERIAEMLVALGKLLKLKIPAEGMETQHQLDPVGSWGCDSAQDFFYRPALRPDEFLEWARTGRPG
jgi:sensor c-di-GMP phosphodiesterase-like protein